MNDDRRRVLAGVGGVCAGVAGCLGTGSGDEPADERERPNPSGPWPAFGRDGANTGAAPAVDPPTEPRVEWTYRKPAGAVTAQPVLGSGNVVVGSHDGYVYCADADTGEHRWVLGNVGAPHTDYPVLSAGVLGPERGYVPTGDGHLTAFDLGDGTKPWISQRIGGDTLAYTAPGLREGTLYTGSDAADLYALGTESGERTATYETAEPVPHPPALGAGALVGATYGAVHAFDRDGTRRWRVEASPTGAPVVDGGRVYVPVEGTAGDGLLRVIDLGSGDPVWTERVPADPASPAVDGNRTYVAGEDEIVSRDATGAERWRTGISGAAAPALAGETVLAACTDGTLRGLDAADGTERWRVEVGGTLTAPAVGDGRVVVGSADGFLAAVA